MSSYKVNNTNKDESCLFNKNIRKNNEDVVERILSILWKREVDLKLTFK